MKEHLKKALEEQKKVIVRLKTGEDQKCYNLPIAGFDEIRICLIGEGIEFKMIPWSNIVSIHLLK